MSDVQIAVIDQQDTQIVLAVPGVQGATGSSIPAGGTAEQVLRKNSSTDYDANWTQVTSAMIANGAIVNEDVNNGAAIAGTKISPDFGGQAVTTTGQVNAARVNVTGNTAPSNGIYLPSANNVAISTNGTGRLFVDASGNVSIGGSTAGVFGNQKLAIGQPVTGAIGGLTIYSDTAEKGYVAFGRGTTGTSSYRGLLTYDQSTDYLSIHTAATERLRITSTGAVNIVGAGTAGSTQAVSFSGSAPVNSLVIDSSGRVGLGTSSPSSLLHLAGSSAQDLRIQRTGNIASAGDTYGAINFVGLTSGGTAPADFSARILATHDGSQPSTTRASVLSFYTNFSSTNASEKMRIDSSGRVGVGTTGPNTLLHLSSATGSASPVPTELRVATTTSASNWSTSDPWGRISFYSSDTSNSGPKNHICIDATAQSTGGGLSDFSLKFDNSSGTLVERLKINYLGTTTLSSASSQPPLIANIGASEAARIDSFGRLLVGTSSTISVPFLSGIQSGVGNALVDGFDNGRVTIVSNSSSGNSVRPASLALARTGSDSNRTSNIAPENYLGSVDFVGYHSSTYNLGATIFAVADGGNAASLGAGDLPTRIVFATSPDNSATPVERARITPFGRWCQNQAAPSARNATATLTTGDILNNGLITSAPASGITLTVPTGNDIDGQLGGSYNGISFNWSLINTSGANNITLAGNTNHTIVGNTTISSGTSASFRTRRTSAQVFVSYRLS